MSKYSPLTERTRSVWQNNFPLLKRRRSGRGCTHTQETRGLHKWPTGDGCKLGGAAVDAAPCRKQSLSCEVATRPEARQGLSPASSSHGSAEINAASGKAACKVHRVPAAANAAAVFIREDTSKRCGVEPPEPPKPFHSGAVRFSSLWSGGPSEGTIPGSS